MKMNGVEVQLVYEHLLAGLKNTVVTFEMVYSSAEGDGMRCARRLTKYSNPRVGNRLGCHVRVRVLPAGTVSSPLKEVHHGHLPPACVESENAFSVLRHYR